MFVGFFTDLRPCGFCKRSKINGLIGRSLKKSYDREFSMNTNSIIEFKSRGIGLDTTPGCFICGGEKRLLNNISAFVLTKEDGELAVSWFEQGARLDYREREPNWIQVKIGACDQHLPNLIWLDLATKAYLGRLRHEIAKDASCFAVVETRLHDKEKRK